MSKYSTVCVIEDNIASVYWIKEIMQEVGFADTILVYNNGKEALDALTVILKENVQVPELIFLDLNMPIMDGWEFLEEFVTIESANKITIYILTSSVDPEDIIKAKKYEAVSDYLVKPITEEQLRKLIRN